MKKEIRYDVVGKMTLMTRAQGYVMARRPNSMPFVISEKQWKEFSEQPLDNK